MSSYIALELDALNKAPAVARAARVSEDAVIGGLARLWAYCFREQLDSVSRLQVAGFFATDVDLVPALVAFGFLEAAGDSIRVRGADRYLRVAEARRKGGLAARKHLVPGGGKSKTEPMSEPTASAAPADSQPTVSPAPAESQPRVGLGSTSALTPTTEHRLPTTEHRTPSTDDDASPPPRTLALATFAIEPPDRARMSSWSAQEFWKAFELERRDRGYPPEKWPSPLSLSQFWTEARGLYDVDVLGMAAAAYFVDAHWRAARPACPWGAFAKTWHQFIPRRAAS